jgi:hypothetical protein
MKKIRVSASRSYWKKYIKAIIDTIEEDKDTILDMLVFGELESAKITMNLSTMRAPTYEIKVNKIAKKSPFGEEDDE